MAPRDFNFVESSIIFGLLDTENFQKFIHPPSSFSRHRKAYDFLVEYYDDMGEMPNKELMAKTFPELDKAGSKTDFRYAIDSKKIKQDLGWQPHETFQSGLRKTINWYLDNKDWWIKTQENIYQQERLGTGYPV